MKWIIVLLLTTNLSFSTVIKESVEKCSESKIEDLYTSLESLEDYHTIDGAGYKIGPFIALDMTQSTPVKNYPNIYVIALRPVPNHVDNLKASQYPHFFMKCSRTSLTSSGFNLNCKQLKKQRKFAVKDLIIDIKFSKKSTVQSCKNKVGINISYMVNIDDQEYEKLKSAIKEDLVKKYPKTLVDLIVDKMINAERFFKNYWRFFFNKWLGIS